MRLQLPWRPECAPSDSFAPGKSQSLVTYGRIGLLSLTFAVVGSSGCANFYEKQALTKFHADLDEGKVTAMREQSTDHFSKMALRHEESDEALEQLRIPSGKFKVLDVEDVSKTERKVTLGFGEDNRRKILYRLVKDEETRKWKVDDIFLRQRVNDKTIAMAVTEQMDVLLSAREFYEAWSSNEREQVLAASDPELAKGLSELPPRVLANLVEQMVGKSDRNGSFRPEAHISGDEAVVRLNRSHGTLVMSMEQDPSGWSVKDLALESRKDETSMKSLVRSVAITNQAFRFLSAWDSENKPALKEVTEQRFFDAGLAPANLADFKLPSPLEIDSKVDVTLLENHADVVVHDPDRTVRLTLSEMDENSENYQVSDVAIYDMTSQRTLSLSSALTARPIADLFLQALTQRDEQMLRYSSTIDLQKQAWSRMSPQTLTVVPFPMEGLEQAKLEGTTFSGDLTHVKYQAGGNLLTVVLHDNNGRVLVDDVLITSAEADQEKATAESLKHYLSAVGPVYELASQIHHNQPDGTVRLVTDDFYDRVFSLSDSVPQASYTILDYISSGKPKLKTSNTEQAGEDATMQASLIQPNQPSVARYQPKSGDLFVEFTTRKGVMKLALLEEDGLLRVDDALVTTTGNPVAERLKQTMRMELATRRTENMIRTVAAQSSEQPLPGVSIPGMTHSTGSLPDEAGQVSIDEQTALKNALYEKYGNTPDRQVQPTAGATPQTARKPIDIDEAMPAQTTPGAPRAVASPQRLQTNEHLLLQPIPID